MIDHHPGNRPARRRESRDYLRRSLSNKQKGEQRRSGEAQQPYGDMNLPRRFHCI